VGNPKKNETLVRRIKICKIESPTKDDQNFKFSGFQIFQCLFFYPDHTRGSEITALFNLCTTILFRRHDRNHQCRHEQKRFDAGRDHDKLVNHGSTAQHMKYSEKWMEYAQAFMNYINFQLKYRWNYAHI
jgi:hypothetical protein